MTPSDLSRDEKIGYGLLVLAGIALGFHLFKIPFHFLTLASLGVCLILVVTAVTFVEDGRGKKALAAAQAEWRSLDLKTLKDYQDVKSELYTLKDKFEQRVDDEVAKVKAELKKL